MKGNLLKLKNILKDPIDYFLPIGNESLHLNPLLGKKIILKYTGVINCIASGEQIKKSYNNGYSYKSFITLPECDLCIVKPELCHYSEGTCRDPNWGDEHCNRPHIIYLAISSGVKVGITRKVNIPSRWMDQGAVRALPILEVKDRKTAGMIESAMKGSIDDKTNWRKMLQNDISYQDLFFIRDQLFEEYGELIDDYGADDLEEEEVFINYPVKKVPEKIKSLSFDKSPLIEGVLQGIKGQYLILDTGVLNIRKHQGHEIEFEYE